MPSDIKPAPAYAQQPDLQDQPSVAQVPEYAPMPSGREKEFFSGLKRGMLNYLVLPSASNGFCPPVKSITLRRPGSLKGKRLIALQGVFGSQLGLLTYLRKMRDEQAPVSNLGQKVPAPIATTDK